MFKSIQAKLVAGLFAVCLIVIGVLAFLWQSEKVAAGVAKNTLLTEQKAHSEQLVKNHDEIRKLESENHALSLSYADKLNKAHQEHKVQINEINREYTASLNRSVRMYDSIKASNDKLSSVTRSTAEEYARTAGNNLSECTAVTGELANLARGYNAEVIFYRNAWPTNPVNTDPK